LLEQRTGRGGSDELQRRATQRSIANQNFQRARELSATGDYYGAIVLLKQTVNFAPDHAEAWHLLGACQERNPKWRRDAAESFQRALSLDPNSVEVLISLGDLYRTSRRSWQPIDRNFAQRLLKGAMEGAQRISQVEEWELFQPNTQETDFGQAQESTSNILLRASQILSSVYGIALVIVGAKRQGPP